MPGYAYPVGATEADTGTAKGVTKQITSVNTLVSIYTASSKTKVNSVLVSNSLGTILPVELYIYRTSDATNYLLTKTRVLKSRYMVLPLVSGDTRVTPTTVTESINDRMIITELILQTGDIIKAKCPIEDVIDVTLDLKEGVSQCLYQSKAQFKLMLQPPQLSKTQQIKPFMVYEWTLRQAKPLQILLMVIPLFVCPTNTRPPLPVT